MNTQVKTWVGTVVVIIIAITTCTFVWLYEKTQPEIAPAQIVKINPVKKQSAVCGKLSQFQDESWANSFVARGGVFNEVNEGCKVGDIFLSNIGPSEFGCDAVLKYDIKNNKLTNTAIQAPNACATHLGEVTDSYVEYFGEQGDGGSGKSFHGRYYFKEDRLEPINSADSLSGWQTYRNEKYGFEVKYPKNFKVSNEATGLRLAGEGVNDTVVLFGIETEFFNPTPGIDVTEWIVNRNNENFEDLGNGEFANKIGQEIKIDGLPTLHLINKSSQSGIFDDFYFIKNNKVYQIKIDVSSTKYSAKNSNLDLNNNNLWQVKFLKSFRFTN